jgi:hypothetical protein
MSLTMGGEGLTARAIASPDLVKHGCVLCSSLVLAIAYLRSERSEDEGAPKTTKYEHQSHVIAALKDGTLLDASAKRA